MTSSGVRIKTIHAVDRGQVVVSFDTHETCWVDLVGLLGGRSAERAYSTLQRFSDIRIDDNGDLAWEGLSLPASEVYAAAKRQARCSKRVHG